jgi:hypothetical protein
MAEECNHLDCEVKALLDGEGRQTPEMSDILEFVSVIVEKIFATFLIILISMYRIEVDHMNLTLLDSLVGYAVYAVVMAITRQPAFV